MMLLEGIQIHEYTPDGRNWLNVALGRVETPDKQQHGQIRTTLSRYNEDELDLSKVPFQPCLGWMQPLEYEYDNNEFYIRLPELELERGLRMDAAKKANIHSTLCVGGNSRTTSTPTAFHLSALSGEGRKKVSGLCDLRFTGTAAPIQHNT